jgi:hypothetical protein
VSRPLWTQVCVFLEIREHPSFSRVSKTHNKATDCNQAWAKTITFESWFDPIKRICRIHHFWNTKKLLPINLSLDFTGAHNCTSIGMVGLLLGERVDKLKIGKNGCWLSNFMPNFTALQHVTLEGIRTTRSTLNSLPPTLTYLKLDTCEFESMGSKESTLFGDIAGCKLPNLVELVLFADHSKHVDKSEDQLYNIFKVLHKDNLPRLKILRIDTQDSTCGCSIPTNHVKVDGPGIQLIKTLDLFQLTMCPRTTEHKLESSLASWEDLLTSRCKFTVCDKIGCIERVENLSDDEEEDASEEEEDE